LNGSYVLCHLCNSAVKRKTFVSIPLRSYANGLWIGDLPLSWNGSLSHGVIPTCQSSKFSQSEFTSHYSCGQTKSANSL
jgi:hypothetical protein